MDMDYTHILGRDQLKQSIQSAIRTIQETKEDLSQKRCVYIYGETGIGKTSFVANLLREMSFDVIRYDAGDVRNKNVLAMISKSNISEKSVLSMFHKRDSPIAIFMDDIDGMNSGDKGGINALIKLIRPKKTKKQRLDEHISNTLICVGNTVSDKKIKELMKVCYCFKMPTPTTTQVEALVQQRFATSDPLLCKKVSHFVQGDLNKMKYLYNLSLRNRSALEKFLTKHGSAQSHGYEDVKHITRALFKTQQTLDNHNTIMNETDRTIIALSWHENVIDYLKRFSPHVGFSLYSELLDNICFGDYIDRLMFQNQVWQLNEMTSLIKTFYNNYKLHTTLDEDAVQSIKPTADDVRFTKVLTKYSTEYNNRNFVSSICERLSMDVADVILLVSDSQECEDPFSFLTQYEFSKLDASRIIRYVSAFT